LPAAGESAKLTIDSHKTALNDAMSKPLIVTWVEQNYPQVECNFYATLGQGAYAAAIGSAFTAQWYATAGFALVGGAAELAYQLSGCSTAPPPPEGLPDPAIDGCSKVANGYGQLDYKPGGTDDWLSAAGAVTEILSIEPYVPIQPYTRILYYKNALSEDPNQIIFTFDTDAEARGATFRILVEEGTCEQYDGGDEPTHTPGEPIADPVVHTDSEGCVWTIQATDAYVDNAGRWHTYYVITANNDACGGPFAYWSSEDGPDFVPVIDPDGGPNPPPDADPFRDINDKLDEIKECACKEPPVPLEGSWVSTRWVSDSPSPGGERPLRKLFRYRSKSSRTPSELQAYWSGFTWSAGPVLVIHHGAWWGNPQVWAVSESEGQRVIRYAAVEAGIDPDTLGKWSFGSSSSPRYGMNGNMRLAEEFGEQWVTRRDGPNGVPIPGVDP
jgi:hypothetical protein